VSLQREQATCAVVGYVEVVTPFRIAGWAMDLTLPDIAVDLALRIDRTVRQVRPDDWRGVQAKENLIKAALYGVLQDFAEVDRLFAVLMAQPEY
jgi:hypothetical protein